MSRRSPRRWTPTILALESREVPTVISPMAHGTMAALNARRTAAISTQQTTIPSVPVTTVTSVGIVAPGYIDPTLLSAKGIAQSRFLARIDGPYAVSPTAYNPALYTRELLLIGRTGSNQFLHGSSVMKVQVPAVLSPPPADGFTNFKPTGFIALRDRNVAGTGTALVLDLQVTAVDSLGRPTQLYWIVDDNGSGGTYAGAPGEGTATITYRANGHSKNSAGGATTVFKGIVVTNGVNDITTFTLPHFN